MEHRGPTCCEVFSENQRFVNAKFNEAFVMMETLATCGVTRTRVASHSGSTN